MPDLTDEGSPTRIWHHRRQILRRYGRVTDTAPILTCTGSATRSKDTMRWMQGKGIRFIPIYGRQAYKIDGKFKFWGGLTVEAWGGGPGLVEAHTKIANKSGVTVAYKARALSLIADGDGVHGVRTKHDGRTVDVKSKCVVLAAGGFQANTEMRTRYLGPTWELAKIRGT
jgi:tricarballylate dehydrogenase